MNGIVFENVSKYYGDTMVVKNLALHIQESERLILLGPSGCGKTTTLRMIAGLETITDGVLRMGGRVMNDVEPGERGVAMVFQNYALYPHMTVWENVAFGLALQKVPQAEIKARVTKALETLNLTGYAQRKPGELSGGQKQRVALARALVKQAPYFLLDEPLSNLDAQLRLQARTELVNIHRIYRPTFVYVTHDQTEAMTIGHRIAILNQGALQQLDTPEVIYQYPANTFVASFIGAPPMNLIPAEYRDGAVWVENRRTSVPAEWLALLSACRGLWLGIRPEHCRLSDNPMLLGRTEFVEHLGPQRCVHLSLPQSGQRVLCLLSSEEPLPEAATGISFSWQHVNVFTQTDGKNIGHPYQSVHTCA